MRLGIVVCPKCKQAKGIDLSKKTSRCPRCGRVLHIKKLKIFYETDSQEQLRQAVGSLNAKLDNKSITLKKYKGKLLF
jgi:ssDNA-binding Zn-finger/Zn-ribbon topoisomerase 1